MAKNTLGDGPVSLTDANKLYLYKVLSEALGCGRQTFLPRAVEALEAVEITPESLGYADAPALFGALADICQLTAFKGGRFYVTVTRREDWDGALEAAEASKKPAGGRGGKPWKRKKGALKPVRPRLLEVKADEDEDAAAAAPSEEPVAEGPADETALAPDAAPEAGATQTAGAVAEQAREDGAAEEEPATGDSTVTANKTEVAAAPSDTDATTAQEAPARIPSILEQIASQTVVAHDAPEPEPDVAPASVLEPATEPVAVTPTPTVPTPAEADTPAPVAPAAATIPAPAATHDDLPRSFADDVSIKPALLGMLTRILPFDCDLITVLDEDLRVARATGQAKGSRSRVTFPLRYLEEDGSAPLTVTIKRTSRPGEARRWQLALVDGDDGTGNAHEAAGIEGLPEARGGYWRELAPRTPAGTEAPDPIRSLAQFMSIGSWETFLGTVATAAAPERWNYPGEGVGKPSRYGILREYLAATLARVRATGRLAVSADGSLAAFDTGLASPMAEELYAVLEATATDIPWRFAGLAVAGSGELGARLVSAFGELPARASYLESIDDVRPRPDAMLIPDYRSLLGEGIGRLPASFLAAELSGTAAADALDRSLAASIPSERTGALRTLSRMVSGDPGRYRRICRALDDAIDLSMRSARQSYRHVAPAYDAERDRTVLLVPLALVDDATTDCALVLELMPSGAYQAASVVTLPRAYAAARVVSREMPDWLKEEDVLR